VKPLAAVLAMLLLAGCAGDPGTTPAETPRAAATASGQSPGASTTGAPTPGAPTTGAPTPGAPTPGAPTPGAPTAGGVTPTVQAYVDAVGRRDLEALVNAFHTDGRIVDVTRTIAGHDAIRDWARNEVIGGRLTVVDVVESRPDGQKLLVRWAPAGSDGWLAHYDFTTRGDRITVADLQYA
jgi:hypothetical protein